ncbi:MAG: DUF3089 domain-containing protein, partial [Anaerovoracaceae bacterium]
KKLEGLENIVGLEKYEKTTDYSDADNWVNLPTKDKYDVDVIFFYPTMYSKEKSGEDIADIDDKEMRAGAKMCYDNQASVFSKTANIYAPIYRQTDAGTVNGLSLENQDKLLGLVAQADPYSALDYYFEHYNKGKPFYIAGHSQGSSITLCVLKDYMKNHPEYYERMIAAYPIGYSVTKDYMKANKHLKFAKGATDTGVIVSYNTEGPENIGKQNLVINDNTLAINPLNWKTDDTMASIKENKGSLQLDGTIGKPLADAKIDLERGSVICTTADVETYATKMVDLFGPASFHGQDYSFYYVNLMENIEERAKTFSRIVNT